MSATAENLIRSKAGDQAGALSFFSYVWKCVVGAEVVYFLCLLGASYWNEPRMGANFITLCSKRCRALCG